MKNEGDNLPDKEKRTVWDKSHREGRRQGRVGGKSLLKIFRKCLLNNYLTPVTSLHAWWFIIFFQLMVIIPKVNIPFVTNMVISRSAHSQPCVSCFSMTKWERQYLTQRTLKWHYTKKAQTVHLFFKDDVMEAVNSLCAGCGLWDYFFVTSRATSVAKHCCGENPPREDWLDFCSREPFVLAA